MIDAAGAHVVLCKQRIFTIQWRIHQGFHGNPRLKMIVVWVLNQQFVHIQALMLLKLNIFV